MWYISNNYTALDSVAIVHCNEDTFATVCHVVDQGSFDGLMVSVYRFPNTILQKVINPTIQGYNFINGIKDFAWHKNKLFVLQDMTDSSANKINAVYQIGLSIGSKCRYNIVERYLTSLDHDYRDTCRVIASGVLDNGDLSLHRFDFSLSDTTCSKTLPIIEVSVPRDFIEETRMVPFISAVHLIPYKERNTTNTTQIICY